MACVSDLLMILKLLWMIGNRVRTMRVSICVLCQKERMRFAQELLQLSISVIILSFYLNFDADSLNFVPKVSQFQLYEICFSLFISFSRKILIMVSISDNAKWILNVKWQMEGVDIHLDVNVGKYLSALGHTLTTLSGKHTHIRSTF